MGKPLFKAPDGGYYKIARVTEDSTWSGLQQGPETSVLVEQKVCPGAFRVVCPCPYGRKVMQISGLSLDEGHKITRQRRRKGTKLRQ